MKSSVSTPVVYFYNFKGQRHHSLSAGIKSMSAVGDYIVIGKHAFTHGRVCAAWAGMGVGGDVNAGGTVNPWPWVRHNRLPGCLLTWPRAVRLSGCLAPRSL